MARSPVTRAQVDAYRFGLRRMDAALVSQDPVPLHEELRGQRRAVAAGLMLAVLGIIGALIWSRLSPDPDWRGKPIVVGRDSGTMYALPGDRPQLVPVANLAAGRLVLSALGSESPNAPAVVVDDRRLAELPRTAPAAILGAPGVVPDAKPDRDARWAVCDTHAASPNVMGANPPGSNADPNATPNTAPNTTQPADSAAGTAVVVGSDRPAKPLPPGAALLVQAVDDEKVYLLHGGMRQEVDLANKGMTAAFRLTGPPWVVGHELIAAIPAGPKLALPPSVKIGAPARAGVEGRVGDIVRAVRSDGSVVLYVLLADGAQPVTPPVADMFQPADPARARPTVRLDELTISAQPNPDLDRHPSVVPQLIGPTDASTVCWHWSAVRDEIEHQLSVSSSTPIPANLQATRLAQADAAGPALDTVYAPTAGLAVREAVPGSTPATAPLWLVSSGGMAYRVADGDTANALGIADPQQAPSTVLALLPHGQALDRAQANRTVDG